MPDRKLYAALFSLIMIVNFAFISPLLNTGLIGDDQWALGPIKGAALLQNKSVLQVAWDDALAWIKGGRWFPLASYRVLVFSYMDRFTYKATTVAMILLNVALLGYFINFITRSRWLSLASMLLPPLFLQLQADFHDSMLSYHFLTQLIVTFTLLSLVLFARYLITGRLPLLISGLLCYLVCLLIYEVTYVFCVLHVLTALQFYRIRDLKSVMKSTSPFVLLAAANAAVTVFLRYWFGVHYHGVQLNYSLTPFLITFLKQSYAVTPLSFSLNRFLIPQALKYIQNCGLTDVIIICSAWAVLWSFISRQLLQDDPPSNVTLWSGWTLVGLALWALPGILIAMSPKYQLAMVWGNGYTPVYISYFGAMIVLTLFAATFYRAIMARGLFLKRAAVFFVTFFGTLVVAVNYSSNGLTVSKLRHSYLDQMQLAQDALIDGLMKFVPRNSYVIAPWPLDSRFIRLYGGMEAQVARPLWADGTEEGVLDVKSIDAAFHQLKAADGRSYVFLEHQPYMLRYEARAAGAGYAVLAPLERLCASGSAIEGALSKKAYVYWHKPTRCAWPPLSIWVVGNWVDKNTLKHKGPFRINVDELNLVVSGSGGKVFEVQSALMDDYIDVKSLTMVNALENLTDSKFTGLYVSWKRGFYGQEGGGADAWQWSDAESEIEILNKTDLTVSATLMMSLYTGHSEMSSLDIAGDLVSETIKVNNKGYDFSEKINIAPGVHLLKFKSDAPQVSKRGETRKLFFMIKHFKLEEHDKSGANP